MKINDKKELHAKESGELKKMLRDGHDLLLSLKMDREQNKLKNTRGIYNTRKTIAIIKTILKGKEEQSQIKDQKSNSKDTGDTPALKKVVVKKAAKKTASNAAKAEAK